MMDEEKKTQQDVIVYHDYSHAHFSKKRIYSDFPLKKIINT